MNLRSILCPVDLDERSFIALATAGVLAQSMNAVLHVVHVLPYPGKGADQQQREDLLHRAIDRHVADDVSTRVMFLEGNPIDEIVNTAFNVDADLIVMATNPDGGWELYRDGIVAEEVAQLVECPVYALRVSEITNTKSIPFDYFVRQYICLN